METTMHAEGAATSRGLRSEPYRLFFPMAGLLAWAGVGHWFLLALGVWTEYRSVFHAMVQVQGVMTCFALGFLFTFMPRRTGAAQPSWLELGLAALGPLSMAVFAWSERLLLAQLCWIGTMAVLAQFAARRAWGSAAATRLPPTFVWVPLSLAGSIVGALLTGAAAGGESWMWLHEVGKGLVVQGLFTGLAIGIGGLLFPFLTRGDKPPPTFHRQRLRLLHAFAWAVFVASFVLEARGGATLGQVLRAGVVALAILWPSRLWRLPTAAGAHRKLVWLSAWCVPLGYALVAAFPAYRAAGLHVTFLGGFGLMAFAVSAHVVLSHSGDLKAVTRHSKAWVGMAALFAVALGARALLNLDVARYALWLGVASGSFLLATAVWAWVLARYLVKRSSQRSTQPTASEAAASLRAQPS
jgi:uncharacterized protein involved in response to NO